MAATLVDNVRVNVTSMGTGALSLGSAVDGYRGVEALQNGKTYNYKVVAGAQWEIGQGQYLTSGNQLVRTPIYSSNGDGLVDLPQNAQASFVALSSDFNGTGLSQDAIDARDQAVAAAAAAQDASAAALAIVGPVAAIPTDAGAGVVGTSDGGNVQGFIDEINSAGGGARVGKSGGGTLQDTATVVDALDTDTGATEIKYKGSTTAEVKRDITVDLPKFNPLRYASSGFDGTADDTAAVQDAINAASAHGCGEVILPELFRTNSALAIAHPKVHLRGKGAGATKWLLGSATQNGVVLSGADIYSIEISHIQVNSVAGSQTGGAVFSFETSAGLGCLDVKLHHFTTFNMWDVISTANSAHVAGTPFLDIVATDFNMRDTVHRGVNMTMTAGLKLDNYTIAFTDPQGTTPGSGSACIYLGDWIDGFWIGSGNILGGETSLDVGSDWSTNRRKPAQGQFWGLSCDSGWLNTARFRAGFNIEAHGLLVGDLAGSTEAGLRIDGGSSGFSDYQGIDGLHFHGGWVANCKGNGMELVNSSKNVNFHAMKFLSNSQQTTNTYHNAYVGTSVTGFGFHECTFDNPSWFGAKKAAYGLFIDTSCDNYMLRGNRWNGANHGTGGLFNSSSGAATKVITDNLA